MSACAAPERFKWIESTQSSSWMQKYGLRITQVIDSSCDAELLAFRNPDGKLILVTENAENVSQKIKIKIGKRLIKADLSAQSFNTFILDLDK